MADLCSSVALALYRDTVVERSWGLKLLVVAELVEPLGDGSCSYFLMVVDMDEFQGLAAWNDCSDQYLRCSPYNGCKAVVDNYRPGHLL